MGQTLESLLADLTATSRTTTVRHPSRDLRGQVLVSVGPNGAAGVLFGDPWSGELRVRTTEAAPLPHIAVDAMRKALPIEGANGRRVIISAREHTVRDEIEDATVSAVWGWAGDRACEATVEAVQDAERGLQSLIEKAGYLPDCLDKYAPRARELPPSGLGLRDPMRWVVRLAEAVLYGIHMPAIGDTTPTRHDVHPSTADRSADRYRKIAAELRADELRLEAARQRQDAIVAAEIEAGRRADQGDL